MAIKTTKEKVLEDLKHLNEKPKIKRTTKRKTTLRINAGSEGETIEEQMERVMNNEIITQINENTVFFSAPEDGVIPESDIRTRRFDMAIEATDKVSASIRAQRAAKYEDRKKKVKEHNEKQKGGTDSSDKVDATASQPTE